jgi:glycosyltransferase involved in cell wall biosynthesis
METRVLPYRGSSLWFVPSVWGRFPAAKRIEAALRELSPSVVHSDFHTLPYAVAACRHLSVPVIFTCYGWWFRPRPWQRAFYRRGPRAILAISEAVKRGFLGKPPFMAPDQVQVLHLGVDTEQFCPRPEEREAVRRELQLPLQAPLVTLLARFQAVKGHDIFLGAARQVACRLSEARFVIAGENVFGGAGDEAFKRRMLAQADADPVLRDRVRFTGWVARSDRLLAASDVVVCSSRFESFGMVLLEAMSSAVPVVSTNVGGPTEIVDDGATGYLVPPGRPDLIAERVLALLQDAELHRRLGLAARGAVKERFELRRYAAGFSKVLEALAADQAV